MIKISLFALAFAVSGSAWATPLTISGDPAQQLNSALVGVGAYDDCGSGSCDTLASQLKCIEGGEAIGQLGSTCTLSIQSNSGAMTPETVSGAPAQTLYQALVTAGVFNDCGSGKCDILVQSIRCNTYDVSVGTPNYACTITPANP